MYFVKNSCTETKFFIFFSLCLMLSMASYTKFAAVVLLVLLVLATNPGTSSRRNQMEGNKEQSPLIFGKIVYKYLFFNFDIFI